jgi:hypothetical protein
MAAASPTGPPPTMITGLCDMVQFTSLSELINDLGVDGGGGACAGGDDLGIAQRAIAGQASAQAAFHAGVSARPHFRCRVKNRAGSSPAN